MNFVPHLIGSIFAAASVPIIANQIGIKLTHEELNIIMPAIILGGGFPDIDTNSTASRIYIILASMASIYWWQNGTPGYIWFVAGPFIFAKLSRHRGWCHSYFLIVALLCSSWIIIIVSALMSFITSYDIRFIVDFLNGLRVEMSWFSLGIQVHLLLDKKWPWVKKNWIRKRK